MSKTKKTDGQSKKLLVLATVALAIIAGLFITLYAGEKLENRNAMSTPPRSPINVNLGALGYTFTNGQATKRTDTTVASLEAFLTNNAEQDIKQGCKNSYYIVMTASSDERQVLLNYGCDYPNARMFAVKDGSGWKMISPTNQFDEFGIPRCGYVAQYGISKDIAPVCLQENDQTGQVAYVAR